MKEKTLVSNDYDTKQNPGSHAEMRGDWVKKENDRAYKNELVHGWCGKSVLRIWLL